MPTQIKIVHSIATPTAALVYLSEPLAPPPAAPPKAANFVVSRRRPGSPQQDLTVSLKKDAYDSTANTVTLQLEATPPLKVGDLISIQGINLRSEKDNTEPAFIRVNGAESQSEANARRTTQAVEDSVAYPLMTENVGTPPSSSYGGGAGGCR